MSTTEGFETISEMDLKHLPNNAKLVLQRQRGSMIPQDKVQFGLPSTFVNSANSQTVWCKGPSIQLEQIPELIEMLQKAYDTNKPKKTDQTGTMGSFMVLIKGDGNTSDG